MGIVDLFEPQDPLIEEQYLLTLEGVSEALDNQVACLMKRKVWVQEQKRAII